MHEVRGLSILKGGTSGFSRKNLIFSKKGLNVYKNFLYKKQTDICGTSEKLSTIMAFFKEKYM